MLIRAGECVLADPEAFDQDDENGTVIVLRPHPGSDVESARAEGAVNICPGRTLSLED